jgi:hypothetical protein
MYCKEMIKIGKAANGYIIEVCVPKKEEKGKKGEPSCCCGSEFEEQFVAKDEMEVAAKIQEILPKLDGEYSTEKEFAAAFGKAVSEEKEDD